MNESEVRKLLSQPFLVDDDDVGGIFTRGLQETISVKINFHACEWRNNPERLHRFLVEIRLRKVGDNSIKYILDTIDKPSLTSPPILGTRNKSMEHITPSLLR